jgi:hypothetical protein
MAIAPCVRRRFMGFAVEPTPALCHDGTIIACLQPEHLLQSVYRLIPRRPGRWAEGAAMGRPCRNALLRPQGVLESVYTVS